MPKRESGDAIHTRSVVAKREDMSPSECEPSALLCPITHEMFRDPVVVIASGHTYERSAILDWITRQGEGAITSPLTGKAFGKDEVTLIQNVALRLTIQSLASANPPAPPTKEEEGGGEMKSAGGGTVGNQEEEEGAWQTVVTRRRKRNT